LFFTLALGIYFASRRAGWFCFIYSLLFICLPRVYLGEHYPTDIVAGAAIGMVPAWLANLPGIREPLTGWALRWMDSNPSQFYCFAFIVTIKSQSSLTPLLSCCVSLFTQFDFLCVAENQNRPSKPQIRQDRNTWCDSDTGSRRQVGNYPISVLEASPASSTSWRDSLMPPEPSWSLPCLIAIWR
jgi:hypothetical protein